MVVVAILGVLGVAVLAIYQDLTTRARQSAGGGTLGSLRSAVSRHIAKNGAPPADQAVLDTLVHPSPPTFLQYSGYSYSAATGVVTAVP